MFSLRKSQPYIPQHLVKNIDRYFIKLTSALGELHNSEVQNRHICAPFLTLLRTKLNIFPPQNSQKCNRYRACSRKKRFCAEQIEMCHESMNNNFIAIKKYKKSCLNSPKFFLNQGVLHKAFVKSNQVCLVTWV
jgi:hypothetical protein